MADSSRLGPWVRRFLLEHLIKERNLSRGTQRSYRDTLTLLIPFVARKVRRSIEVMEVSHVSADLVKLFLRHLEENRGCAISTRNQRLAAIHSLARFVALHSPEHIAWCEEICLVPFKKCTQTLAAYLEKAEIDALLAAPNLKSKQGSAITFFSCSSTTPAHGPTKPHKSLSETSTSHTLLGATFRG